MLTRSAYVYNAIFRVRFAYMRNITSQEYARSDAKILRANGGVAARSLTLHDKPTYYREIDEKREETGGGIYLLRFDK